MQQYFKFMVIVLVAVATYASTIDVAALSHDEVANEAFVESDGSCWQWATFRMINGVATCKGEADDCTKPCDPTDER